MSNQLSVGLITYKESRYLDENKLHNEFSSLTKLLNIPKDSYIVIDEDKYGIDSIDLNPNIFIKGILYFLLHVLSVQIGIIKKSKRKNIFKTFYNFLIGIYNIIKIFNIYILQQISFGNSKKFKQYVLRQKNITQNHIEMMQKLSNIDNNYILILEDDFIISENDKLVSIFDNLINHLHNIKDIKLLNISKSFTEKELGINENIVEIISIPIKPDQTIVQYNYPVPNTACAILYKKEICEKLVFELEKLNKYPFIPIDHKLNIGLMALIKSETISYSCYASVVPGILVQGSLHG